MSETTKAYPVALPTHPEGIEINAPVRLGILGGSLLLLLGLLTVISVVFILISLNWNFLIWFE